MKTVAIATCHLENAHAVNQTGCMEMKTKAWVAFGSTMLLTVTSLFSLPYKYYSQHTQHECIDKSKFKTWTPASLKKYTVAYMNTYYPEWGRAEQRAVIKLWGKESAWNHQADNPESTAYGVAQVLKTKHGTPAPQQVARGLSYIEHRYDRPSIAWSHWRKHGWY